MMGVTGRQGMLTPPRHLILLLEHCKSKGLCLPKFFDLYFLQNYVAQAWCRSSSIIKIIQRIRGRKSLVITEDKLNNLKEREKRQYCPKKEFRFTMNSKQYRSERPV
jgi:hypothetical protein